VRLTSESGKNRADNTRFQPAPVPEILVYVPREALSARAVPLACSGAVAVL